MDVEPKPAELAAIAAELQAIRREAFGDRQSPAPAPDLRGLLNAAASLRRVLEESERLQAGGAFHLGRSK